MYLTHDISRSLHVLSDDKRWKLTNMFGEKMHPEKGHSRQFAQNNFDTILRFADILAVGFLLALIL